MSPESFKSHNVFQKLEQLKEVIKMKNAKEIISLDDLDFFDTFYHYIIGKLKLTIPILIQSPEIDGLSSEIEAGTGQINTYLVNKNTGHINNAKNNFISALTRIKNLPFPHSKNDFNFSKEISDFQFNVKEKYDQLTEINKKIDVDLKTTQDDLISKQNQIFDLEKKLSEKETEIQNVLSKYNSEFETFKITGNTNLESDRKKFSNIFEEDRKQFKEQFESDKENLKKIFDETTVSTKDEFDNASEVLNSKLEEAKKIVNIIGNIGVTGNYQKIANENGKAANIWRMISMTFMIIMSILVIWSIYELSVAQYDVYKSLVRILAAAVLTYPAIYASRESSKHRNLETRNRTLELELASIGPFIEILPEETKQKIKRRLS
ncbi:MAG: hypothetical protein IPG78_13855 [Ignavibacteria bacterium]|nr:hypothetical protein [Ignavibacteria bacterium]